MGSQAHLAARMGLQKKADGKSLGDYCCCIWLCSGVDVGEPGRQAGRRAKHRVKDSNDKLESSTCTPHPVSPQ